jgi:hypothetical protein
MRTSLLLVLLCGVCSAATTWQLRLGDWLKQIGMLK